jgi:DNA repair protein RadC
MTEGPKEPLLRVRELEVRYKSHRLHLPFEGSLERADDVATLAEDFLRDITTDAVLVLHLTKKLQLLGIHRLPVLPNSETTIAETFRGVLLSNAHALIYVHYRASDNISPSPEDRILVQHIRHAAKMFGTEVRDAVIVSNTPHDVLVYSFRDNRVF